MAKGTGVFQPRYGLMAQQVKKSQHSGNKSSCEHDYSTMTPIVLALQQQLHLQQMQKVARGKPRRSSVCSTSSSCVSSGSGSLSPAAVAGPLLSPCHSNSLSALSGPFASSSDNCMNAPQFQQQFQQQLQQQVLPAPQPCFTPLMVPVDLCPSQRTNQLELHHQLLQEEAALDAALQQLLTLRQQLALSTPVANSTPVVPLGLPCQVGIEFQAPSSHLVSTSSCSALANPQQQYQGIACSVSPFAVQQLVQELGVEEQRLQAAEEQLQQQLQAEVLHLLDLVA